MTAPGGGRPARHRRRRAVPGLPAALALAAALAAAPRVSAQDERPAIVGPLTGEIQPAAPATAEAPVPARDYQVLESREERLGNRKIVFQRVFPPPDAAESRDPATRSAPAAEPADTPAALNTIDPLPAPEPTETVSLTLAATVVDRRATLLRWSWNGEAYEAWSSADWMLLTGVGTARRSGRLFSTLLLASEVSSASLPPDSPLHPPADLSAEPGAFVLTVGDPGNAAALETVRTLTEIYRNEQPRLRRAFAAREELRKEREAAEAARRANPPDIVVRYWKVPNKKQKPAARPAPPPDSERARLLRERRAHAARAPEPERKGGAQ